jgi:endo-1,4-beta-D-glucanase Y
MHLLDRGHFAKFALSFTFTVLFAAQAYAGNRPFPQHTTYTTGTIKPNNASQSSMDSSVQSKWTAWKNAYLKPAGTGKYYVKYNAAGETVSEAHGYGMLLTAMMEGFDANAKTYFDGLYNYYKAHPSANNPFLMSWKQNSSFQDIEGVDGATDGDMDIAYSLLLADKQWGSSGTINYLQAARNSINAIMQSEVNQSQWHLRLGDWATSGSYANSTRPSDFMLQHMKAYQSATGDTKWANLLNSTYTIMNTVFNNYSPNTGLLPDFLINSSGWKPAPANFLEGPDDGHFNYNSCRTPWRITTDYLITGDTRALSQLRKMNSWIRSKTSNNSDNIMAGYTLGGTATADWTDNSFTIPFGVSAMTDAANQSWLNSIWTIAANTNTEEYYPDSIRLISMIVISGNWWSPDATTNTPPTITNIADQSIGVNTATNALAFTVGDAETAASSLTLTKSSSNTSLVPLASIVFGGSDASRSVTVTPAANQTGTATITVTVSDGTLTTSNTFDLSVTATPIQAWRLQYFGTADSTGNAADLADPDRDNISNLIEFALNTDPTKSGSLPTSVAREGADLTLTYSRRKSALGEVAFSTLWANAPDGPWNATGVSEQILSDDGTLQQVKARVLINGALQKFFRLRITRS